MRNRLLPSTTRPGLTVLLASMSVLGARDEALAVWKSAKADPEPSRFRVSATTASEQAVARRFYRLDPGDVITFPVHGSGAIRIKSRCRLGDSDASYFRYVVDLDHSETRRFKRRVRTAEAVDVRDEIGRQEVAVRVGSSNTLELPIPEAIRIVRLWVPVTERNSVYVRVLLGDGVSQPVRELPFRTTYQGVVQLPGVGYDTNANLAPQSSGTNRAIAYWPLRGAFDCEARNHVWRFDAAYDFDGVLYNESMLNESRHTIRAGAEATVARRLRMGLDGRYRDRNTTFIGRGEEAEFETTDDNGALVSLADRFDFRAWRGRATTKARVTNAVDAPLYGAITRKDYHEDYGSSPDVYALDHSRRAAGAELEWDVAHWRVAVGGELRWTEYDEKFSRDENGDEAPTVATRYADRIVRTGVRYRHGRLSVEVDGRRLRTVDRYAGYWNATNRKISTGAEYRWESGLRLAMDVSRSWTDYENARLGYDTTGALREKAATRLNISGRHRVNPFVEFFVDYRFEDVDNNSTEFAYRRTRMASGVALRL